MFLPVRFHRRLAVNGAQTAKVNYGINRGWLPTITRTSGHKPLRPEAMIPIRKAHLDGRAGQWQAYGSVSIYGNTMPSAAIKNTCPKRLIP